MKVVHIITGLATGGAEMTLWRFLAGSRDSGHATVIGLGPDGNVGERIRQLGSDVIILNGHGRWDFMRVLYDCVKACRRIKPDLIMGWMYDANIAAWVASRVCRSTLVWNIRHSLDDIANESPGLRLSIRANKVLARSPCAIVFNSRQSASHHAEFGFPDSSAHVIPNGYDLEVLTPDSDSGARLRCRHGIPDNRFVVGLIARYHPMKDHAGFISAASKLLQRIDSAHFLLAGRGVDRDNGELTALISQLGIAEHCTLLGEQADIVQLNSAIDVAVSASAWGEAFSNTVCEAMACERPVVATSVGDADWIVGDCGRLVSPGDPDALAAALAAIHELGEDGRKALGKKARQRIQSCYTLDKLVTRYHDLFDNVVSTG